jgi:HEPN domain-containing protein
MTPRDLATVLLRKARQDLEAVRVLAAQPTIADDVVGFHAQQAIEKAVKATLIAAGVRYGRTHALAVLLDLLEEAGIERPEWADRATLFDPYAVTWRYAELEPDERLDREDAVALVGEVVEWCSTQASSL